MLGFILLACLNIQILNKFILNDLKSSLSIELNSLIYWTNTSNNKIVIKNKLKLSLNDVLE